MTHLYETPAQQLREQFGLTTFVETGCEDGEGLTYAKSYGFAEDHLYSCDIRKEATDKVSQMFPEATLVLNDSLLFLGDLVPALTEPTLFWLDAHFPALYKADGGTRWPLFQELDMIKRLKPNLEKDVFICDDMRVLQSDQNPRFRPGELQNWLVEVDWNTFIATFADTHEARSLMVDTGLMVFTPKTQ